MRAALGMQKFVTTLARRHGFSLIGTEALVPVQGRLVLEMEGFAPITIEVPERNVVRVCDYNDREDGEILEAGLSQPFSVSDFFIGGDTWVMIRCESLLEYLPLAFAQLDDTSTSIIEVGSTNEHEVCTQDIELQVAQWESEGWLDQASGRISKRA